MGNNKSNITVKLKNKLFFELKSNHINQTTDAGGGGEGGTKEVVKQINK